MLGPEADPDDACRNPPQHREHAEQPERPRQRQLLFRHQDAADDPLLNRKLHRLRELHRQEPPLLDGVEVLFGHLAGPQRRRQNVRRRHRVLNGEIDADPADRRHGVRSVADAEQARPVPLPQPVNRDGQELHIVPALDLADAPLHRRRDLGNAGPECLQAACLDGFHPALGNDEGALPVIPAVQHDEEHARFGAAEHAGTVALLAAEPEPQHVHRRAVVFAL